MYAVDFILYSPSESTLFIIGDENMKLAHVLRYYLAIVLE